MELPTQTAEVNFDPAQFVQALRKHAQLGAFPDPNGINGSILVEVDIDGKTHQSCIDVVVSDRGGRAFQVILAVEMPADHQESWFIRLTHDSDGTNRWTAEQQLYVGVPGSKLHVGTWHEK